jgi:hypothetical protein
MTMKYFRNPDDQQVYGYDPQDQQFLIDEAISQGWLDISGSWPPPPEPVIEPAPVDPVEKLRVFLVANPDVASLLLKP